MTTNATAVPITPKTVGAALARLHGHEVEHLVFETPEVLTGLAATLAQVRDDVGASLVAYGKLRAAAIDLAELCWVDGSTEQQALTAKLQDVFMALVATALPVTVSLDLHRVATAVADTLECTDVTATRLIPAIEIALRAQGLGVVAASPLTPLTITLSLIPRPRGLQPRIRRPSEHGYAENTGIFFTGMDRAGVAEGSGVVNAGEWTEWHDANVVSWSTAGGQWIERDMMEASRPWTPDDLPDGTLLLYVDGVPTTTLHASRSPQQRAETANACNASHVAVLAPVGR